MLPNRIELFDAARVSAPKPEEVAANAPALASAPITLVAPPRTISDVTAILDEQKPDIVKVAELTATADAPVPNGLKGPGLADFYYRRAQARALLGRDDALADAELAVSNGQGSDYANAGSRHQQLLMRRPREAGQHKRASTILAKQMAAFANKGKGNLFGLNYQAAIGYIRNGDTNAAETRNRSLPAEAQRVGDPEHLKVVADAGAAETLVRGEPCGICFTVAPPPPAISERRSNTRVPE